MNYLSQLPFPARFVLLNLIFLGLLMLSSALGFGGLHFFSAIYGVGLAAISILTVKAAPKKHVSKESVTGWVLFLLFSAIAYSWLHELFALPSNDDTINHLAFLEAILKSGHVLLGKVLRPGSEYFGLEAYHFYPTGAHGLLALHFPSVHLLKTATILILGLWPALLWWSSFRLFPTLNYWLRLFLVVSAATTSVFPLNALGEGGFSRVFALIFFVPVWFEALVGFPTLAAFFYTAIAMPILLFIHPAILPLIGVSVLFQKNKSLIAAVAGLLVGGGIFYLIIHTATQEVATPGFLETLIASINPSWFDRMKGPFHYWFADPFGIAKFLSPKNFPVFLALFWVAGKKLSPKTLLLFAVPFAVAALALIPVSAAHQLGIIFYHSVKRISEITPLLGFTIGGFAIAKINANRKLEIASGLFVIVFTLVFIQKSNPALQVFHDLFHSPREDQVAAKIEELKKNPEGSVLIIDDHAMDVFRFALPNRKIFTLLPECTSHGMNTPYCQKRVHFIETIKKGAFSTKEEVWWIAHGRLERVF